MLTGRDRIIGDRAEYIRERLKSRREKQINMDSNPSNDEEMDDTRYRRVRYKQVRQVKRRRRRRRRVEIGFTCERDVFRGTVGDTCYIIPLMYWIKVFGKDVMLERLRVIQFELLVKKMDEYVAELLCYWDASVCDVPLEEIQTRRIQRRNDRNTKRRRRRRYREMDDNGGYRIAATFRYQDNKNFPEFIIDENVLSDFNDLFAPCNDRLIELLGVSGDMSDLMLLHEFDINHWDYKY